MVQLNTYQIQMKVSYKVKILLLTIILQLDNDKYVSLEYCMLEYLIDKREHEIDNYNY
jgi:hypothetical protein